MRDDHVAATSGDPDARRAEREASPTARCRTGGRQATCGRGVPRRECGLTRSTDAQLVRLIPTLLQSWVSPRLLHCTQLQCAFSCVRLHTKHTSGSPIPPP
eukprot:365315-Chlamydomonas_euryale.AAC.11